VSTEIRFTGEIQDTPNCTTANLAEADSDDVALVLQYLNVNVCSN